MKKCNKCDEDKPFSDFHKSSKKKDGLQARCKDCNNAGVRQWQSENPDKFEAQWRKQAADADEAYRRRARKYGLTVDQLDRLLEDSAGLCAICGNPPHRTLVVDHCHTTGAVRGILCEKCNQGLGMFKDNPTYLQNAIAYLS